MAVAFETIKEQIVIVLYDYMLTSDHHSFWFSFQAIRDPLSPEISGAFLRRALDSVIADNFVEDGIGDPEGEAPNSEVFALTQRGISQAEFILRRKGWNLSDYNPSPQVDRIISRVFDTELHEKISNGFSELSRNLRESNEAGQILGDQKQILADELEVADTLASKESFRVQRLAAFILPALRFLADKLIGSALGETAKRLIDLLMKAQ